MMQFMWKRWSAFWIRADRWARDNPSRWALVAGVVAFLAGLLIFQSLVWALVMGVLWVPITWLSVSRGPGRKFLDWRLRGATSRGRSLPPRDCLLA